MNGHPSIGIVRVDTLKFKPFPIGGFHWILPTHPCGMGDVAEAEVMAGEVVEAEADAFEV